MIINEMSWWGSARHTSYWSAGCGSSPVDGVWMRVCPVRRQPQAADAARIDTRFARAGVDQPADTHHLGHALAGVAQGLSARFAHPRKQIKDGSIL